MTLGYGYSEGIISAANIAVVIDIKMLNRKITYQ